MFRDRRIYCEQGPECMAPLSSGELSGYSFVFKDLFDVEGYVTGAGNPEWLGSHKPAESTSPLILELLQRGARCVGRVQTDELAYSLNGRNVHYGTPVNPAAPDCLPGGSSSGSAVAVASGEADFAIGTDTGGSIRVPASYCGLFGLRPTVGSLDLANSFTLADSFDTAGILSRDLDLLRLVYGVLVSEPVETGETDILYLDEGLAPYFSEERFARLNMLCRKTGIELVHGKFLAQGEWRAARLSLLFRTIQGFEIIENHGDWLAQHEESLDPAILQRVRWARGIDHEQYQEARELQLDLRKRVLAQLQGSAALWVMPTTPSGPPSLSMDGGKLASYRSDLMGLTSLAGLCGLPQLHLPLQGLPEGPCGISLMGLPQREAQLLTTGQRLTGGLE